MMRCLACGRRSADRHSCPAGAARPASAPPRERHAPPVVPGVALGEWLGAGGFSEVWAARRDTDGRQVAVKIAHAGQLVATLRMRNEAEALRLVGPPTVPELYAAGTLSGDRGYLVMERLRAPTLAAFLAARDGRVDVATAFTLARALVAALERVHERGLVHRDLKPENLFVEEGAPPRVRVADFGIVTSAPSAPELPAAGLTAGGAVGSAEYMAPEQRAGDASCGPEADVYALSVILYELFTGRVPFVAASAAELQHAHAMLRPPPPSLFAPAALPIDALVARGLAKDPAARIRTIAGLAAELERAAASATVGAPCRPVAPGIGAAATRPRHARQKAALLLVESAARLDSLEAALAAFDGRLTAIHRPRHLAIFCSDEADNPVARAARAGTALLAQRLATRAVVELDEVTLLHNPDGSVRYLTRLDAARGVPGFDAVGRVVAFTAAAAAALPDGHTTPLPGAAGLVALAEASPPTTPLIQGAPSHGRDAELDALGAAAQEALDAATPAIATVLGAPGMGKSHLAAATLARVAALPSRPRVLTVCARDGAEGAQATLRWLVMAALELGATATADDARARLHACVGPEAAELWPAVALVLGWIAPDDPSIGGMAAAPGALRAAVARGVGEVLRCLARARPLCLFVDDVHACDHVTLDALEYAALSDSGVPLWICALARPSFEASRAMWGERAGRHLVVRLEPLTPAAAFALCRQLLLPAEYVPDTTVARLVTRSGGVPLMLVELVRGLKREGLVRQHRHGSSWYLASDEIDLLPELPLVEWLAGRELARLPPELARSAQLAAQLGLEFTAADLAAVLAELDDGGYDARFTMDAGAAVRALVAAEILTAHRDGRLRFRHALVREAIARLLPEATCSAIHDAAYRVFSARSDDEARGRAARHAALAGRRPEAAAAYLRLAARAAERHDYVEAERLYTQALAQLERGDDDATLQALIGRARMRYRLSRNDDALADFAAARALAAERGDRHTEVALVLDEATVHDWIDDFARSRRLVDEAAAAMQNEMSPILCARLAMARGRTLWRASQWHEARAPLEEAVARADGLGDAGYETLVESLLMLGEIVLYSGDVDEAERIFNRALALSARSSDRLHLAVALNNRRSLFVARRDGARGAAELRQCMKLSRESGFMTLEFFAQYNLGELLYLLGSDDAEPEIVRAIELGTRRLGRWARPVTMLLQARHLAFRGRDDEARRVLERIDAVEAQGVAAGHEETRLLANERVLRDAVTLLGCGRDDDDAWNDVLERSRRFSIEQEAIEVVELRGLAALRQGRTQIAAAALADAMALARQRPSLMQARLEATLARVRARS